MQTPSSPNNSASNSNSMRQRSLFTNQKVKFNPAAPEFVLRHTKSQASFQRDDGVQSQGLPFHPHHLPSSSSLGNLHQSLSVMGKAHFPPSHSTTSGVAFIGPTHLPVNSRVWSSISSFPRQSTSQQDVSLQGYQGAVRHFGPLVLPNGIIQLNMRDSVTVEMTIDKSIKVVNKQENVTIALSNSGYSAALQHPNGIIFQNGHRVDIAAYDGRKKNNYIRYAKMWQKGISLTSEGCALIYLVDSAGTRTTSDVISIDLRADYVSPIFLDGSRYGSNFMNEANSIVQNANFWLGDDGTEIFHLNGFRISQTVDGLVKISRPSNKSSIRTSPSNGSATITTQFIHCTASLGQTSHLFVRRDERRMHFDGTSFVVRNAGHSAGFDDFNRLRVY